jgi:hypothetical protein
MDLPASVIVRSITGSRRASSPARGSGGIRVLHADDANGGLEGVGNTNRVRNLDVDKVGAASPLTGADMVMVIIIVEIIKLSRREEG